jgi:hypothetical protein
MRVLRWRPSLCRKALALTKTRRNNVPAPLQPISFSTTTDHSTALHSTTELHHWKRDKSQRPIPDHTIRPEGYTWPRPIDLEEWLPSELSPQLVCCGPPQARQPGSRCPSAGRALSLLHPLLFLRPRRTSPTTKSRRTRQHRMWHMRRWKQAQKYCTNVRDSTFTPVPKRVQEGTEDIALPAAIISGAPMELQARTVRSV